MKSYYVLPRGSELKKRFFKSPFTCVFLLFIVAIHIIVHSQFLIDPVLVQLLGAFQPELFLEGEYWRIFTGLFLHANIPHLFFNGFALYVFGTQLEYVFKSPVVFFVFVVGAMCGFAFSFFREDPVASIGASAGVFALFAWLIVFKSRFKQDLLPFDWNHPRELFLDAAIYAVFAYFVPQIDHFGHLGGFVWGLFCGVIFSPQKPQNKLTPMPMV